MKQQGRGGANSAESLPTAASGADPADEIGIKSSSPTNAQCCRLSGRHSSTCWLAGTGTAYELSVYRPQALACRIAGWLAGRPANSLAYSGRVRSGWRRQVAMWRYKATVRSSGEL